MGGVLGDEINIVHSPFYVEGMQAHILLSLICRVTEIREIRKRLDEYILFLSTDTLYLLSHLKHF